MNLQTTLKFADYDCIGFDLDNTLSEYNLYQLSDLEYKILAKYLIEKNGYESQFLLRPLIDDINFIRKGLILDIDKGNVLDIAYDGTILRASHGTRILNGTEIIQIYGQNARWSVTDKFCEDFLKTWNGPLALKMRSLLDYFDIAVSILFARVVDYLDLKEGKRVKKYNIWPDILNGLFYMYSIENFQSDIGEYFPAIKNDPNRYIKHRSTNLLNWLWKIKESGKYTFLITGSNADYANLVAESSLGTDWKKYFDIIVFYARKPGFFTGNRPFIGVVDKWKMKEICPSQLKIGSSYSQGNWNSIYQLFQRETGKERPKCVYIGDNLIQDIYTPNKYCNMDTIAVVNELKVENPRVSSSDMSELDKFCAISSIWHSYFNDPISNKLTIWGKIIKSHSKICVPDIDFFINKPLDYEFECFNSNKNESNSNSNVRGYYPDIPTSLKCETLFTF